MAIVGSVTPQNAITVEAAYIQVRDVVVSKSLAAHATADIFKSASQASDVNKAIETIKFSFTYNKASESNLVAQAQVALRALTSATLLDGTVRSYNFTEFEATEA